MTTDPSPATAASPARGADPASQPDAVNEPTSAGGRRVSDRPPSDSLIQAGSRGLPVWALVGALAVLTLAGTWFVQDRIGRVERDLARRLQETELRDAQREQQMRLLADTMRDAQGKTAVLEAKLADSLGQQLQLRQLYDEMARTRGDLMLADVENSIMIAAQQLQLGGNVQSALLALSDAEQVLARSNQPSMLGLRRVLTRDIERLKSVPLADFAAAVNRLDAVIGLIEQMPLLADLQMSGSATPVARPDVSQPGLRGLPERVARTGLQGWDAFVAELRTLVRVQRVDQPEALLMSPDQRFFVRESLRLQLLNARLNLLARNEALFRADLARATAAIGKWFDGQHRSVVAALGALRQLQATRLAVDLPSLAESIAAVRAARAASDAR
jgi:uncharacterized protein HemX